MQCSAISAFPVLLQEVAMNILSPKVVTVAIMLQYCHLGPNGLEDAITPHVD